MPVAGDAQQATKLWRVGHLGYAYPAANDLEAFRHRLRDLGYVEGKNLVIESRSAESGFERLPELAAELVGLKVDVIAAFGNRTIMALKEATPTISWLQAAADDRALVDRGQKNTERMLKALLGALGFGHVKVVFEEPRPRREPGAAVRPRLPAGGPCTRGRVRRRRSRAKMG